METAINIEKFDNGIALHWHAVNLDLNDKELVIYNSDIDRELGKIMRSDIEAVMNTFAANEVKLSIKIEPIEDDK
jgi:hypothetical protein